MPKKKYLVDLAADERESLRQLIRRGKHSSRKVTRARILLLAADGSTDEQIVAALSYGINTVERTRHRFVEEGLGCSWEGLWNAAKLKLLHYNLARVGVLSV